MKRQTKIALIDESQLSEVRSLIANMDFEFCWLSPASIKQEIVAFHATILIVHSTHPLAENVDFNAWLIEQHVSKIIIFEADVDIKVLNAVLSGGNGDCLVTPIRLQELSMAIQRCTLVAKLVDVSNYQFQRLKNSNIQIKESHLALQSDLAAGRKLQKDLLPETPYQFKQLRIEHNIIPSLYLSGDYIDYRTVLDRYCLFLLTDVAGHGSASAFVTVMIKQMMDRVVNKLFRFSDYAALNRSPEGFFELINHYILDNDIEKHVAGVAGMIDTQTNQLHYTTAAHMPSLILVMGGKARFLKHEGRPIGLFADTKWSIDKVKVDTPFTLYCLSDGIYDVLEGESLSQKDQMLLNKLAICEPSSHGVCEALDIDMSMDPVDDVSILMLSSQKL